MSLLNNLLGKKGNPKTTGQAESAASADRYPDRDDRRAAREGSEIEAGRKSMRGERREALYGVIRECMVRQGVLSSGYRFRVLSMDAGGSQYMIMLDVAQDVAESTKDMKELEAQIEKLASERHGLDVKGVYWRANEELTSSGARARTNPAKDSGSSAEPKSAGREMLATLLPDKKGRAKKTARVDFEQTQMLDESEITRELPDFAATQMLDFREMDAPKVARKKS